MMMDASLWQFAVQAWRRPGVERACLALQDDFSVPVASVLLAGWLGAAGYPADPALARTTQAIITDWETTRLAPLRGLRRQASAHAPWRDWARLLREAELEGERLLYEALDAHVRQCPKACERQTLAPWFLLMVPSSAGCEGMTAWLDMLHSALTADQR